MLCLQGWGHLRFNSTPVLVLITFWQMFWVVCVKRCSLEETVFTGFQTAVGLRLVCADKPHKGAGLLVLHKAPCASLCQDGSAQPLSLGPNETLGKKASHPLSCSRNKVGGGRESPNKSWEHSERKMPLIIAGVYPPVHPVEKKSAGITVHSFNKLLFSALCFFLLGAELEPGSSESQITQWLSLSITLVLHLSFINEKSLFQWNHKASGL